MISKNELSDAMNMAIRDTKLVPRPGIIPATSIKFTSAPAVLNAAYYFTGAIAYDATANIVFGVYRSGSNYIVVSITAANVVTAILTTTDAIAGLAVHPANGHVYYIRGNGIRRMNYDGTSGTTLISDARNSSGVPPVGIALDLVSGTQRIYWTTSRHVMRSLLNGTSSAALIDGGATNTTGAIAVDPANNRVYWANITDGTIRRSDLDGSNPGTLLTLTSGWDCVGLAIDTSASASERIFFTEYKTVTPEQRRVRRVGTDGASLYTIAENSALLEPTDSVIGGIAHGDNSAFVAIVGANGITFGKLLRLNTALSGMKIVSAYAVDRSMLGVVGADGIRDFTILQLLDATRECSHYAFWQPDTDTAFVLQNGYYHSREPGVPHMWVTNSRDANVGPDVPLSKSAEPATYLWQQSGINTPRGGVTILDGGVPDCDAATLGTTPDTPTGSAQQNEIQVLSIAGLGGGNWKIRVDYGTVGDADSTSVINISSDLADNADAAAVKTVLELLFSTYTPFATSAEFTVTGGAGGPWTVEFTGDYAGIGFPIMAAVDSGTPENINPADRTQLGQTPSETIIEEVHSFSLVGGSSVLDEFYFTFFDDDLEVQTPNLTRNSTAADVRAAFGLTYTASNLDVSVTGAGTMSWSCTIRYTGDYAGRTFNLPVFEFVAPMSWSLAMVKEERTVRGSGVEVEPEALPSDLNIGKPNSPFVFNYVLGDTVQQIETTVAGPVVFRLNNRTSEIVDLTTATAAEIKAALEGMDNIDYVVVQYHASNARYTVRFRGIHAGKCVSALVVENPVYPESVSSPPTPGAADVTIVQEGGTETGSMLIFRPTGIPTPKALYAEPRAASGVVINATVSYVATFFSDDLKLESPVSVETPRIGLVNQAARIKIPIPDTMWFDDTIPADPGGVQDVNHVRMVNKIRIWRRKFGRVNRTNQIWRMRHVAYNQYLTFNYVMDNGDTTGDITLKDGEYTSINSSTEEEIVAAFSQAGYDVTATFVSGGSSGVGDDVVLVEFIGRSAGRFVRAIDTNIIDGTGSVDRGGHYQDGGIETEVDGVGATPTHYLVAEINIDPTRVGRFQYYIDRIGDAEFQTDEPVPGHDYPPEQAKIGTTHLGMSIYATGLPGDNNLWISELPGAGNLHFGELGGEYVYPVSFEEQIQYRASDKPMIGLHRIGRVILIGYSDLLIRGDIVPRVDPGRNNFEVIEGATGFASSHCILEARDFAKDVSQLLWIGSDGHMYGYSQGITEQLSGNLKQTALSLIRRTWHKPLAFDDTNSWVFCTAVLEPTEQWVIISAIVDSTRLPIQIVYDLRTRGIMLWNIGSLVFWRQREWNANDGQLFRDIVLCGIGTDVFKLADMMGDNGEVFSYFAETGDMALADSYQPIKVGDVSLDFDLRKAGVNSTPSDVAVTVYKDLAATASVIQTNPDAADVFQIKEPEGLAQSATVGSARRMRFRIAGTQGDNQDHAELITIKLETMAVGKGNR